jgi:predicted Zn-dependent protease
VEETEDYARKLSRGAARPVAGSRMEFLRKLDGLPVGPRPRDGIVEGERFSHPDLDLTLRFPAGWKVQNARGAAGAVAPDGDAIMLLQTAGDGNDPDVALRAFEEKAGGDLGSRAEHLQLGGLPAIRTTAVARTRDGPLALVLTWVAHANRVFRITGVTPASRETTYRPAFREATATFRPLAAAERGGFRETRLRLVAADEGETLGALVARAGVTGWSLPMIAVANDIDATARLRRGQLVKVPRAEPYRPH